MEEIQSVQRLIEEKQTKNNNKTKTKQTRNKKAPTKKLTNQPKKPPQPNSVFSGL